MDYEVKIYKEQRGFERMIIDIVRRDYLNDYKPALKLMKEIGETEFTSETRAKLWELIKSRNEKG